MAEQLTQQEREARAQYFRNWRRKNKEKVKRYNQTYWQRRAERMANEDVDGGEKQNA